jgi:hypothetical protein
VNVGPNGGDAQLDHLACGLVRVGEPGQIFGDTKAAGEIDFDQGRRARAVTRRRTTGEQKRGD